MMPPKIGGKVISECKSGDSVQLAWDGKQQRVLVNTVMDFAAPLSFLQGFCSFEIFTHHNPRKSKLQISEAMWQCALMYLVNRVSSEVPRRQY
jgi:hypothetical protein